MKKIYGISRMPDNKPPKYIQDLGFAVLTGNISDARQILDARPEIDLDKEKVLMFSVASENNMDGKMTRFLLKRGASPRIEMEAGYSPLILATQSKNIASTEYLLKAGANIFSSFEGKTALDYAKEAKSEAFVKLLQNWEETQRNSPEAMAKRHNSVRSYLKNRKTSLRK